MVLEVGMKSREDTVRSRAGLRLLEPCKHGQVVR